QLSRCAAGSGPHPHPGVGRAHRRAARPGGASFRRGRPRAGRDPRITSSGEPCRDIELMIGPVLSLELMLASRRRRYHLLRWTYAYWLSAEAVVLYLLYWSGFFGPLRGSSEFASFYVRLFVVQQIVVALVAMPSFAAGSLGDDKVRGTLQHLLTTPLT